MRRPRTARPAPAKGHRRMPRRRRPPPLRAQRRAYPPGKDPQPPGGRGRRPHAGVSRSRRLAQRSRTPTPACTRRHRRPAEPWRAPPHRRCLRGGWRAFNRAPCRTPQPRRRQGLRRSRRARPHRPCRQPRTLPRAAQGAKHLVRRTRRARRHRVTTTTISRPTR